MLKSKKHVFWEALMITIVIFIGGILLGILIETSNSNKISNLYTQSEISLTDTTTVSRLSEDMTLNCDSIKQANINLANKIYEEAKNLEKYEDSGKLTENLKLLHKKYDILRTILWTSNIKSLERCDNYNLIVYLYEYESKKSIKKATQEVWSKILLDAKEENTNILLLPIASDQELISLEILTKEYNITQYPAVIINNKQVLYEIENIDSIMQFVK